MKKVIVTGSNGLLGQTLVNLLLKEEEKYNVIGFSKAKNRNIRPNFEYVSIDMTNAILLYEKLKQYQPDVIINTAAMTNVDACEENKTACDNLNINVVQYLKEYSNKNNTHLIHISTDFIFDGKKEVYKETDAPNPLNYYGLSKLKSESILLTSNIKYTIIRTTLVYGKVFGMLRSNIVLWIKKSLENREQITVVTDQYRMPTYVEDLAFACKLAIDKKVTGIFNISSNTLLSIYEIAQEIAIAFNLDKNLIQPITTKKLSQKAIRPFKTGFDLTKTHKTLMFFPKSFGEDLQRFKEKLT